MGFCLESHRGLNTSSDIGASSEGVSPHIVEVSPTHVERDEPSYHPSPRAVTQEPRAEESRKSLQIACLIRCFVEKLSSAVSELVFHRPDLFPCRDRKHRSKRFIPACRPETHGYCTMLTCIKVRRNRPKPSLCRYRTVAGCKQTSTPLRDMHRISPLPVSAPHPVEFT